MRRKPISNSRNLIWSGIAAAAGFAGAWWLVRRERNKHHDRYTNTSHPVAPELGVRSEPFGYLVPVQAGSPWPTFRRDHRNSGASPLPAFYGGDHPWHFQTAKGIFSTPIIGQDGSIFVGSGDHTFYALNPDGSIKWQYKTGEIIDSAGAILKFDAALNCSPLAFISGDGNFYCVRSDTGDLLWKYEAELRTEVSFNRWFEGNVAVGYDGTLFAGNTNFLYYALTPSGKLKWTYATGSNNWSQAAFGPDGTLYWGSCDTFIHAVNSHGNPQWRTRTLGFIAASAAIGVDGSVYIGSFDSNLYALDPGAGEVRWKFPTGDHIYSSAALSSDPSGATSRIYIGSTDGWLYAVDPDGKLLWKFPAGDPIRSSPVIGRTPDGEHEIVYFGCGDGNVYALNDDGRLRWKYDTTPADAELRDRNDLNGSPALGQTGLYIGGEHGELWYLPYDYPLHNPQDPRGMIAERHSFPTSGAHLAYVTPGGSTLERFPAEISSAPLISLRLRVYEDGSPILARFSQNRKDDTLIQFTPEIPFTWEPSADGRYLHILPQEFLSPETEYTLRVSGEYLTGGKRLGNLTLGGRKSGLFEQTFRFQTHASSGEQFPLQVHSDHVDAFEWTRLAAVLPTMLPSLNQLGFDYMHWLIAPVIVTPADKTGRGKAILWVIGARRDQSGILESDPHSDFTLALNATYQGNTFILRNQDFRLAITGISIPFRHFELRGEFDSNLVVQPGAAAIAETAVLSIPNFGPKMVLAGLANHIFRKLFVTGTYITRPYRKGSANLRPKDIQVVQMSFQAPGYSKDGWLEATLGYTAKTRLPAESRRLGLVLINPNVPAAVSLDYHPNLQNLVTPEGDLAGVRLRIPAGTKLPSRLKAVVIVDVFPIKTIQIR